MILIFGGAHQGKLEFARELLRRRNMGHAGQMGDACREDVCRKGICRPELEFEPVVFECKAGGAAAAADPGADIERGPADFSGDPGADIIYGLEEFVWDCCAEDPEQRIEAAEWMEARRDQWQDKILIIRDVSQGIVPMDARTRAFREMSGRLMMYLAREAEEVYRVFCGIGKRIK